MKKLLAAMALLGALAGLWLSWRQQSPKVFRPDVALEQARIATALSKAPPASVAIIESNFASVQSAPVPPKTQSGQREYRPRPPGPPAEPEFTVFAPATVLENARTAIRNYGSMFGGNPVGNNQEITQALNGSNPRQVHFLDANAGLRLNSQGELIDPWSTPFFFHQLSGKETEIRSAGPDRVMYTSDDLVLR